MFKYAVVIFALLAVAAAQYLASPYAYSGLYRSGAVVSTGYPGAVTTYSAGVPAAYPYAGYAGYNGLLYK